jgi:hypothetical protein
MEKTWQTDPNFTIATTSSALVMGQSVMMTLKNHMVSHAGWTVVGSSDGVSNYEFEGITGGGSYGGDSTGSYDVWADIGDVRRGVNGSGLGWCILKSPAGKFGPFYALIAMEGTDDDANNGYTWYSDTNWVPHPVTPLLYLPTRAPGAAAHGRSRYTFILTYSGTYTTRGYFSGAEDGSFLLTLNLTIRTWFTGLQMFHVMDSAHPSTVMPTCSYSQSTNTTWTYTTNADQFYAHHPRYDSVYTGDPTEGSGVRSVATFPQYMTTRIHSVMTTTNYASEVDPFPLFLASELDVATEETGRSSFVGRIPDLYSAPEGLNEGDTMPLASPEHFVLGNWLLPGDTIPLIGP